mmetsp:Transcript_14890/g.32101  ORF Transcript_14890/g.32101 Transcript_14890/m.32101 type:complete len:217 (-) Transcript_14890:313-963(-)
MKVYEYAPSRYPSTSNSIGTMIRITLSLRNNLLLQRIRHLLPLRQMRLMLFDLLRHLQTKSPNLHPLLVSKLHILHIFLRPTEQLHFVRCQIRLLRIQLLQLLCMAMYPLHKLGLNPRHLFLLPILFFQFFHVFVHLVHHLLLELSSPFFGHVETMKLGEVFVDLVEEFGAVGLEDVAFFVGAFEFGEGWIDSYVVFECGVLDFAEGDSMCIVGHG